MRESKSPCKYIMISQFCVVKEFAGDNGKPTTSEDERGGGGRALLCFAQLGGRGGDAVIVFRSRITTR